MSKPRRISELQITTSPTISDTIPVVQSGVSKKTTLGSVFNAEIPAKHSTIEITESASVTGSLNISGSVSSSYVHITDVLSLDAVNPLPTGSVGMLAISASGAVYNLYYHNGSDWSTISYT